MPADGDSSKNELTIAISIATDSSTSKISSSEVFDLTILVLSVMVLMVVSVEGLVVSAEEAIVKIGEKKRKARVESNNEIR